MMLDRKLLRDIVAWRGSLAAIVLIVACGIAAFVAMQSVYDSLRLTQEQYYERFRFAAIFATLSRAPQSLESRIAAIPGVRAVQTRVVSDVSLDLPGRTDAVTARLVSIPTRNTPGINDLYLRDGRLPRPESADEAVASEAFAQANGLRVGEWIAAVINRRYHRFRIVGIGLSPEYVYEIRGATDIWPDNRHFGVLWLGRKTLGAAFDLTDAFNDVVVDTRAANVDAVIASLDRLLAPYGSSGAYAAHDQVSNRFLSDEIGQLRVQAIFIPAIFLAIAAFLLDIAVSRLVATQRSQIAVLKALGYANASLLAHYAKLVLLVVALGAAFGTLAGAWLGWRLTALYAHFFHFPFLAYRLDARAIAFAVAIASLATLAGAALALARVAALAPAQAMRPPSPPTYRPTALDRVAAIVRLPLVVRMVARDLERRSGAAIGTTLAVAFSVAMIVVGRFGADAVAYMIDVQFRMVQREDVNLAFVRPLGNRARFELASLPGVREIEVYRSIGARLSRGTHSRRVAILGFPDSGSLAHVVDRTLRVRRIPRAGLLLSAKLAEILGVRPGDRIEARILEGRPRTRELVVSGVVDDVLGLNAYMNLDALHRLLDEGGTISGALLAVDPARIDAFDRRVKALPAVAGIGYRASMMQQFERTIAETMGISIAFLLGFAASIACGVMYDAGRISLSERARDLSTLRILGATRREIAGIVFGELGVPALVAVPLGCALGYALCVVLAPAYETETYRIPVVVSTATYAFAALFVAASALGSSALLSRDLRRLDVLAVLKAGE
ncbi:MAG: FtsX-like permease family protein [bacterium]|nr:FtsX-like permease family protein [bacterium]